MGTGDPLYELRRDLLLAGIEDTQGTIHANDTKCSAALVTHALVFAGLVTVTVNAARLYPKADHALRAIAIVLAALALVAFLTSVICLLVAVMPYRPKDLIARIKAEKPPPPGVFFPEGGKFVCLLGTQRKAVAGLTSETATFDLVCESAKLAAIRTHEGDWAARGYRMLILELLLAGAYLTFVGIIALNAA